MWLCATDTSIPSTEQQFLFKSPIRRVIVCTISCIFSFSSLLTTFIHLLFAASIFYQKNLMFPIAFWKNEEYSNIIKKN
jgi:hypothetical protein